jgi:Cys-rich protein (TIGR01571 family)
MSTWSSGLFDVTAEPGGIKLFAYACCCSCLAAGDVAVEAGGNYWASCALPYFIPCLGLLLRCDSRAKLAVKHAVPQDSKAAAVATLCCLNGCALRQELAHIAKEKGVPAEKLLTAEGGVILRKPAPGEGGKAVGYAVSAARAVISSQATTGMAK